MHFHVQWIFMQEREWNPKKERERKALWDGLKNRTCSCRLGTIVLYIPKLVTLKPRKIEAISHLVPFGLYFSQVDDYPRGLPLRVLHTRRRPARQLGDWVKAPLASRSICFYPSLSIVRNWGAFDNCTSSEEQLVFFFFKFLPNMYGSIWECQPQSVVYAYPMKTRIN